MEFLPQKLYHIYTRGNNKQAIFFSRANYLFFLGKVKKHFTSHADILSYCLMPNHFHFLVHTNESMIANDFSSSIRTLLSSYSRAINIQEQRSGSLFQQNCKAKEIVYESNSFNSIYEDDYLLICFNYIHQNPLKAGLVSKMEDWEFSSYRDYIGLRNGALCNQDLAFEMIDFGVNLSDASSEMKYKLIQEISVRSIDPDKLKVIF